MFNGTRNSRERERISSTRCLISFFVAIFSVAIVNFASAGLTDIHITDKTNPKIAELYNQLLEQREKISAIESERGDALAKNFQAMQEKEQSWKNKALTAGTTLATSEGAMSATQAYYEQRADADNERDMTAYLATMRCEYGDGKNITVGNTEITLPGGNELLEYYSEYKALADNVKQTKSALGLRAGIESEILYDRAQSSLYQYDSIGRQSGANISLANALMDSESEDAAKWKAQKEQTAQNLTTGTTIAVAGAATGIAGNYLINKDATKEQSEQINQEYDAQVAKITQETEQLENDLNDAIAENAKQVKQYNEKLAAHTDFVKEIKSAVSNCKTLFNEYISQINSLTPIENDTDTVSETQFPDLDNQKNLLKECTTCTTKGGLFNPTTMQCPCPAEKSIETNGICTAGQVIAPAQVVTGIGNDITDDIGTETTPEQETEQNDPNICEIGFKHTAGFGIEPGKTRVGDECKSAQVLQGRVFKRKNGTCGCTAIICETRAGRAAMAVGGRCVCDKDKGYKEENGKCVKSANENPPETTETTAESTQSTETESQKEYKYYNCGDTRQLPNDVNDRETCRYIDVFSGQKVTPTEADGLMKEYALEKYNDTIVCDDKSHRIQSDGEKYRQCATTTENKRWYEFKFKSLDAGNKDFFSALCSIWNSKYGKSDDNVYYACKDTVPSECEKISAAVKRTFFPGGEAIYKNSKCIIKVHEDEAVQSSRYQVNSKAVTIDKLKTTNGIDPAYFYSKDLQINLSSELYKHIQKYIFNTLRLPVAPMQCFSGIIDNVFVIPMTAEEVEKQRAKQNECIDAEYTAMIGARNARTAVATCTKKYPIPEQMSDLLTCEYNGNRFDLMFKKLDVKWDKKSIGGYQGLTCLSAGGEFTGKNCTLASKAQCDAVNAEFKKQYPTAKGMEWDPNIGNSGACVLLDAKEVRNIQKAAEVTGMVALTLVTSVAGGPVVWVLSAVETTAFVTEAATAAKLSDWAEGFIVDAARCNDSSCADRVLQDHIARIIYGSHQFNDTQNKNIAHQMQRLLELLDKDILDKMVDAGISGGYIGENRDPDLEKSLRKYYNTKLTNGERALLGANYTSTVLTFATLIGAGVTAGLRQAFKRNWIHISPERQAKWLKYKILRPDDVAGLTPKTADVTTDIARSAAREITYAEANELAKIDQNIARKQKQLADLKGPNTTSEARKLNTEINNLRNQRNKLLNKIGTHDADEIARLQQAAFDKKAIEDAQSKYKKLLNDRDAFLKNQRQHGRNPSKYELQEWDKKVADAEQELRNLGQEVTPAEPLWKEGASSPTPRKSEPKAEPTTPKSEPATPTGAPTTPQNAVRAKLGDKVNADIESIKSGKAKELHIPRGQLTDDEWKILKDDLVKDGMEITEAPGNMYYVVKKSGNIDDVAKSADEVAGTSKSANKTSNADDAARGAGTANSTTRKLQDMGFVNNGNGVFISKQQPYSYAMNQSLDDMSDIKWTYLNVDGTSEGPKIYIAMSNEVAAKQGLRWSDEAEDFVRTFNSQSSYRISKLQSMISSRKVLTEINGVPVYVRNFGEYGGRPIVMVEINGKKIPFYASTGSAGKNTVPTGKWEFFGGIGPDGWFNKLGTDDILAHYNSPELRKIANALDSQIGDVRNVEYVMMSRGRASLNGAGSVGAIDNVQKLSTDVINSGLNDLGYYPNVRGAGSPRRNIEGVTDWLSKQRASTSMQSGTSASRGASNAGARVAGSTANINTLRNRASQNFDTYLAEAKRNANGKSTHIVPKSRLNDAEWKAINKSLAHENVQLVEVVQDGEHYMQFRRADAVDDVAKSADEVADTSKSVNKTSNADDAARGAGNAARNAIPSDFSPIAKEYINQINDIGQTRDYVVIKGVGKRNSASPLTRKENDYVNQLLEGRNDLIARPITQGDGTGGTLGANKIIVQKTDDMFSVETSTGIDLVRRLTTKPVDNLRGKSITTINGKPVFLELLDNGGLIGNIEGRPVVVVNYNGHKIPFYTSSGKAGKLKVPTGKWEVFFGFGKDNTGFRWLNKADIDSIVDHYGSPELRKIAEALDNAIGDQRNLEDVFQTISRKIYNGIGNVASYDGPVASEDFINSMLDFVPVNHGDNRIFSNIEHVKSYFK